MIAFNEKLNQEVIIQRLWGNNGAPWEFNLRDMFRWCDIIKQEQDLNRKTNPGDYVYLIYASRFRNKQDRESVYRCFKEIFGHEPYRQEQSNNVRFSETHLQIGQSFLNYKTDSSIKLSSILNNKYSFTNLNLKYLESIIKCLEMNWMAILGNYFKYPNSFLISKIKFIFSSRTFMRWQNYSD